MTLSAAKKLTSTSPWTFTSPPPQTFHSPVSRTLCISGFQDQDKYKGGGWSPLSHTHPLRKYSLKSWSSYKKGRPALPSSQKAPRKWWPWHSPIKKCIEFYFRCMLSHQLFTLKCIKPKSVDCRKNLFFPPTALPQAILPWFHVKERARCPCLGLSFRGSLRPTWTGSNLSHWFVLGEGRSLWGRHVKWVWRKAESVLDRILPARFGHVGPYHTQTEPNTRDSFPSLSCWGLCDRSSTLVGESYTLWIKYANFNDVRQRVPSLQDLFKTVKADVILDYLKTAAPALKPVGTCSAIVNLLEPILQWFNTCWNLYSNGLIHAGARTRMV